MENQREALFALAALPPDARPAGWDFLFLTGTVLGAAGAELLFQTANQIVRLAIANESPPLFFRENLRMLSHAPKLTLQLIARFNPLETDKVVPLAISAIPTVQPPGESAVNQPRLELPAALADRVCLGFDEIQSGFLIHQLAAPAVLSNWPRASWADDPLDSLRRRWIATLLSGFASQGRRQADDLIADIASFNRRGFITAAELLDALVRSPHEKGTTPIDTCLAIAQYLRCCTLELAHQHQAINNAWGNVPAWPH